MAKKVTGFSLNEGTKEKLHALASARGLSASAVVDDLIVKAAARKAPVEVTVDGVRYVPARGGRK